jgi:hypothetical protein
MDFEFFEKLSQDEANAFLSRFRELEAPKIEEMRKQSAVTGFELNFSIQSIAPFMRWALARLVAIPKEPDSQVSWWIRNTDSYIKRLFEFDDQSKSLILRVAYYLGESFVKSHSTLRWGTGNPKYAQTKMPVVVGFRNGKELPPILVADNLLGRVTAEPSKLPDVEKTIECWDSYV